MLGILGLSQLLLWYSCSVVLFPLEACLEVLARELVYSWWKVGPPSIQDGHSLPASTQPGGDLQTVTGKRTPSICYQPNQLWWSMGWQMSQSDCPHILLFPLEEEFLRLHIFSQACKAPLGVLSLHFAFPRPVLIAHVCGTFSQFCTSGLASCMCLLAAIEACSDCCEHRVSQGCRHCGCLYSWEDPWVRHPSGS